MEYRKTLLTSTIGGSAATLNIVLSAHEVDCKKDCLILGGNYLNTVDSSEKDIDDIQRKFLSLISYTNKFSNIVLLGTRDDYRVKVGVETPDAHVGYMNKRVLARLEADGYMRSVAEFYSRLKMYHIISTPEYNSRIVINAKGPVEHATIENTTPMACLAGGYCEDFIRQSISSGKVNKAIKTVDSGDVFFTTNIDVRAFKRKEPFRIGNVWCIDTAYKIPKTNIYGVEEFGELSITDLDSMKCRTNLVTRAVDLEEKYAGNWLANTGVKSKISAMVNGVDYSPRKTYVSKPTVVVKEKVKLKAFIE